MFSKLTGWLLLLLSKPQLNTLLNCEHEFSSSWDFIDKEQGAQIVKKGRRIKLIINENKFQSKAEKMKLIIICVVFSVISLVCCTPLPQSSSSLSPSSLLAQLAAQGGPQTAQAASPQIAQAAQSSQLVNGQSAPMTAQSVNSGINFTQQFMQLLSMLFNNFNSIVPRFVNLFTGQNPTAAGGAPTQSIPSIPGLPSLTAMQTQGFNNLNLPEKMNNAPNTPRDTELSDNDIINDAVDILTTI